MGRISIDVTDAEHAELEALLDERIRRARTEGASDRTVKDIFEQARPDGGPDRDA